MSCIFRSLKSEEGARLLKEQGQEGSFLIVLSSKPPDLTLLYRTGDEVKKARIQHTSDHYEMCESEQFATLPELIHFYSKDVGRMFDKKSGEEIVLKHPFVVTKMKKERWFHGNISFSDAEKRLKREKPGSFLIRISATSEYVLSYLDHQLHVIHLKITEHNSQYTIGEGNYFNSLPELIAFYKKNSIQVRDTISEVNSWVNSPQKSDKASATRKILLTSEAKAGRIRLSQLEEIIEELSEIKNEDGMNGFEIEFQELLEIDEFESISDEKRKLHVGEREKNRYKNILPYETTRVKLIDTDPKKANSDYINASYIKMGEFFPQVNHRCYIATQGCLVSTVADFWLMIWQANVNVIVMLTQLVEGGRNKCVPYWPEKGSSVSVEMFGGYKLKVDLVHIIHNSTNTFSIREFTIEKINKKGRNEIKKAFQFHYELWPDKDSPNDIPGVLEFLIQVDEKLRMISNKSPIVVHCSAGVGRTGTYILIDAIIQCIKKSSKDSPIYIDIKQMVLDIRRYRSGMVQTPTQYIFIYKAIQFYMLHFHRGRTSYI